MKQLVQLIVLVLLNLNSFGQNQSQFSYYNYTLNNGLPSNEVYTVFQDSKGFIWIGTDHGLARFDGSEFKIFTKQNGLSDNNGYEINETPDGKIITNTFHGGVCIGNENGFTTVPHNDYILEMSKSFKWRFVQDQYNKIWLNLYRYGNAVIDNSKVIEYPFDTLKSDSVNFYFDNNHNYLFFTRNNNSDFSNSVSNNFPGVHSFRFAWKDLGEIYKDPLIALYTKENILFQYGRDITLLPLDTKKPITKISFTNKITFVKKIAGSLWVGTMGDGIYQYSLNSGKLLSPNHFFENLTISNVIKDREGNYWFSTTESGVFFVPSINYKVISFRNEKFKKQRINYLQTDNKYLYAGGSSAGQYQIASNGDFSILKTKVKQEDDITGFILNNGNLVSNTHLAEITQEHPFFAQNKINQTVYFKLISKSPEGIIAAGYGGAILLNSNLKMLWSTQQIGFGEKIESLFADKDSTYYLGTRGIVYRMKNRTIDTFLCEKNIVNHKIQKINIIADDILAIATKGNGVLLYNKITKKLIKAVNKDLASNIIEDLFIENDSTWWAATYNGISRIHYSIKANSYSVLNLNTRLGLPSNEINTITKFDNRIWAGTNNGIFSFSPSKIGNLNYSAPVLLTRMLVNNHIVKYDSISTFPYNQNNFQFEFTALSYRSLGKIRYEYKLAGLSDQWFTTEDRNIRFTALTPGIYTLLVRISDPNIYTYSQTISYNFEVTKPFYARVWFITLIILCGLGILVFIINNIITKSKSKYKILEAEQHALRSQMNPHFVFNVLNSIQASILENDKRNAVLFLSKFSMLIRRVLNNSKKPFINLKEEVDVLNSYLEMEHFRMGDKLSFSIKSNLPIELSSYSIPSFIIQPFVENAIWHGISPSKKPGLISITFEEKHEKLLCTILDNGVGLNFEKNKTKRVKHVSVALKNIQERFDSLNKYMNIETYFNIDEVYGTDGEVSGTKASIFFPLIKEA